MARRLPRRGRASRHPDAAPRRAGGRWRALPPRLRRSAELYCGPRLAADRAASAEPRPRRLSRRRAVGLSDDPGRDLRSGGLSHPSGGQDARLPHAQPARLPQRRAARRLPARRATSRPAPGHRGRLPMGSAPAARRGRRLHRQRHGVQRLCRLAVALRSDAPSHGLGDYAVDRLPAPPRSEQAVLPDGIIPPAAPAARSAARPISTSTATCRCHPSRSRRLGRRRGLAACQPAHPFHRQPEDARRCANRSRSPRLLRPVHLHRPPDQPADHGAAGASCFPGYGDHLRSRPRRHALRPRSGGEGAAV